MFWVCSEALALKPELAKLPPLSSTLNCLMYLSPFRDTLGNTHASINSQSDPVRTPLLTSILQLITRHSQSLYPLIYGCLIYRNIKRAKVSIPVGQQHINGPRGALLTPCFSCQGPGLCSRCTPFYAHT